MAEVVIHLGWAEVALDKGNSHRVQFDLETTSAATEERVSLLVGGEPVRLQDTMEIFVVAEPIVVEDKGEYCVVCQEWYAAGTHDFKTGDGGEPVEAV